MITQYLAGTVAFLVCVASLPAVRSIARKFNLYDDQGHLKIHQGQIPRIGGIAMMLGLTASALLFFAPVSKFLGIPAIVFAAVWAVGLLDDIKGLSPYLRFAVQIAAGASLWFGGWRLGLFAASALDLIATCVFVAFLINAMNFLDGMDGLCAAMSVMIAFGFLGISGGDAAGVGRLVAASLAGATAGVLIVNFPPATMFMGDSGSTLIGVVLAFLSLNFIRIHPGAESMAPPLLFLAIPMADALGALLRRASKRASFFEGDRRHFYDILLQKGWPVRRVLATSLEAASVLILAGWLCARGVMTARVAFILLLGAVLVAAQVLRSLRRAPVRNGVRHPVASAGSIVE